MVHFCHFIPPPKKYVNISHVATESKWDVDAADASYYPQLVQLPLKTLNLFDGYMKKRNALGRAVNEAIIKLSALHHNNRK